METVDTPPPAQSVEPPLQSLPMTLRDVPWRGRDVIIGLAPLVLERMAGRLIDPALRSAVPRWIWLLLWLASVGWMLFYPLWIARRRGARIAPVLGFRKITVETLIAAAGLPVLAVVTTVTIHGLTRLMGQPRPPAMPFERLGQQPIGAELFVLSVVGVTVAPVAEEMFFRGFLFNAFRRRANLVFAAILQAALFGAMHPFDFINVTAIAAVGFLLALLYAWRKTLLSPMLMHAVTNAAAMAMLAAGAMASASAPVLGVNGTAYEGGCRIEAVLPGSAAERAGLRVGDVITTVDGDTVTDIRDIAQLIRRKAVGDPVLIEFMRHAERQRVEAILKKRTE